MNDQNRLGPSVRSYDVFINHRGPDVKDSLVSCIYNCLSSNGLNVFFDKEEFQAGQELAPTIAEAIRTSSVHIAIFSRGYADSHWCLDELCLMLDSGAPIIPVFFDVSPAVLQEQRSGKGFYGESLKKLEIKQDGNKKRYDSDRLTRWREGLKKVSNISGLEFHKFNRDLGKLVHFIGVSVTNQCRILRESNDALDDSMQDFEYFLKENENVRIVGIVGPAGSGKTTLAEEYYHRQHRHYNKSSLLEVRGASERDGLQNLQSQLLKDLTNTKAKINNISSGKEILKNRINGLTRNNSFKLLIVMNDVDNRDQLEALLPKADLLGTDSLVIVTSRDKSILILSRISLHYEMKPLVMDDAQELLCEEAFHQAEPIPGFKDLVETTSRKCGGLPGIVKLIGEHLHLYGNNNEEDWKRELEIISDIPDIADKLKASYAALVEVEQQIFLDIACFFVGMEKNSAIRIWDGFGCNGVRVIQKLQYCSLVQIDDDDRLKMNNYLSNLGREIADQQLRDSPHLPFRLWRSDEATNFLDGLWPVPKHLKIRGSYHGSRSNLRHFGSERFKTTISSVTIELLDVDGDLPDDIFGDRIKNLLPSELREVRLENCSELIAIPPKIGSLRQLQKITLNGIVKLESLPPEFCELQALKHLEVMQCGALKSFPERFGDLTNLQHIEISDCENLSKLPESFGQLSQLKYLELRNCSNLEIERELFGEIKSLEQLSFQNCCKLRQLPTQITCQGLLRKLNLLGTSLEELPDDIHQLEKLQILYIGSHFLTSLPASLGNLPCLSELLLFNCTELIGPPPFQHLHLKDANPPTFFLYGSEMSDSNVRRYVDNQ